MLSSISISLGRMSPCTLWLRFSRARSMWVAADDSIQLDKKLELLEPRGMLPSAADPADEFARLLRQCGDAGALAEGSRIHAQIVASGLGRDRLLGNLVVEMYGKCGSVEDARKAFDDMRRRNVISWTIMISAYVDNARPNEALQLFRYMELEGVKPDRITFVNLLQASANLEARGREMHARILAYGFETDGLVQSVLLNMYGKCGNLEGARVVFDRMQTRNVVSMTAMISAYAQNGHPKEALELLQRMDMEGIKADRVTLIAILDACIAMQDLDKGKIVHARVTADGFETDIVAGTALINMYSECGCVEDAKSAFEKIHTKDLIAWTAMVAAYVHNGHHRGALHLLREMDFQGLQPNKITYASFLDACTSLAAISQGREIHARILEAGLESDELLGNALLNMYGSSGILEDAKAVFGRIPHRNAISWTALIAAHANAGLGKNALDLFLQMNVEGTKPDDVTFISVLISCSHTGLVEDGLQYFHSMSEDYGMTPTAEHYNCMVDLLGRAGWLNEAEELMNIQSHVDSVSWVTLLGACRMHGDLQRGARIAEFLIQKNPKNAAMHVLLSNIYSAADDANCSIEVGRGGHLAALSCQEFSTQLSSS